MDNVSRVERVARPFAAFGLLVLVAWTVAGVWTLLSGGPIAIIERHNAIANSVGALSAASMLVAFVAAVRIIAYDERFSARARGRWIIALLLTHLLGASILIIYRWINPQGLGREHGVG